MSLPPGWQNPITAAPGAIQQGIDPKDLLPSRPDLVKARVDAQRALLRSGRKRYTPIQVSTDGVIWDGHHAVRAAAEEGAMVEVQVVSVPLKPAGSLILQLPVR
jgi:hypothetical protein